jgi:hypothetical protein
LIHFKNYSAAAVNVSHFLARRQQQAQRNYFNMASWKYEYILYGRLLMKAPFHWI